MADPHAPAAPAHADGGGKKKTPFAIVISVVLLTLLVVVAFMIENPLVQMGWSSFTQFISINDNGFRNSGTGLMRMSLSMRIFTQGFFQVLIVPILIAVGAAGTAIILFFVRSWVKKATSS